MSFGKRVTETRFLGRSSFPKFHKVNADRSNRFGTTYSKVKSFVQTRDDWNKWVNFVRQFYKSSISPKKGEVAPTFSKRDGDNRPFISVQLNGKFVEGLLDTGSNCSIIGRGGLDLLKQPRYHINMVPSKLKAVITADGKSHCVASAVELEIGLQGRRHKIFFYVVPDLIHKIVLGSDFCRLFALKLDFRTFSYEISSAGLNNGRKQPKVSHVGAVEASTELNSDIDQLISTDFDADSRKKIKEVIGEFKKLNYTDQLSRATVSPHRIDTGNAPPFKQRQFWWSPYMLSELNREIDKMLKLKVIEPSNSSWSSPILLVKKPTGEFRVCFDGRKLNSVTVRDNYPLPLVDRILSMLGDAKYISSVDLKQAFWQIPLEESSKPKTAFAVPGRGLFHFTVMPFGLTNAAQALQRLMDELFGPELEPQVFVYLDDLIILSKTFDEHLSVLRDVARRLSKANLSINLDKCKFFRPSLKYLGFIVDQQGLRTNPEKVESMANYPVPKTSTEIKRFVGMCSWYRRFVPHFSSLIAPLNRLLKGKRKRQKVEWDEDADLSFRKLKEALVSAPVLASPNFSEPFTIHTDASDTGLGGLLTQTIEDQEKVIAYASRSLSKTERNYSVTERECLAVVFALEKFRPYVEGVHFTVITDHYSLLWLKKMKDPVGKLARWSVRLNQFSFDLVHRKGCLNVVPDALSRLPAEISSVDTDTYLDVTVDDTEEAYATIRKTILGDPQKYLSWKVEGKFIFKYFPNKINLTSNVPEWKLFVPESQRVKVLRLCHDEPTSSHLGYFKTLSRLKIHYYWPKVHRDVRKYVLSCQVCSAQKAPNVSRPGIMGKEKIVQFPWQIISVDLIGPLPRSKKGFTYLFVIVDWFSKYVVMCPLRKANSPSIVNFLENEVFLVYGVPQFILVDNGKQFIGKNFIRVCKEYKVQKIWFTAKYHPQANPVERYNRVIGTAIRCYIKGNHENWDAEIAKIGYAIRTAVSEITGFSPAFLNFGRVVPCTGEFYGKVCTNPDILTAYDREKYARDLESLQSIFQGVMKRLNKAYVRNSRTYNLRKRDVEFFVGDRVWKRNKVLSNASKAFAQKLAPRYVPCTVRRKLSKLAYELVDESNANIGVWHIKDLKPFISAEDSDVESQG